MKYDTIRKSAIYTFILVSIAMTFLSIMAIWFDLDDVAWKAFTTIIVIAFGSALVAYAASMLDGAQTTRKESLPSFAPHPAQPIPPANHLAQNQNQTNHV